MSMNHESLAIRSEEPRKSVYDDHPTQLRKLCGSFRGGHGIRSRRLTDGIPIASSWSGVPVGLIRISFAKPVSPRLVAPQSRRVASRM